MADTKGSFGNIPYVVNIDSPKESPEKKLYQSKSKFGLLAPEYRVYIEGVQVPFESIYVTNTYGQIPTASVTLPYLPFIQEIARNYPAKIHIFFKDHVSERYFYNKAGYEDPKNYEKYEFRLLFAGVIKGSTYSKSKGYSGASTTVSFQCQHKNYVASEVMMSFARFNVNDASIERFDEVNSSTAGLSTFTPQIVAQQALQGVDSSGDKIFNPAFLTAQGAQAEKENAEEDTAGIPKSMVNYHNQFSGVPGVILRLWNIICYNGYNFSYMNDMMKRIYIPLMSNIRYFEGMVGHPLIEDYLEKNRGASGESDAKSLFLDPLAAGAAKAGRSALGAVSVDMTIKAIMAGIENPGGADTFTNFFNNILQVMMYDSITLTCPAMRLTNSEERPSEENEEFLTLATPVAPVETIIRPVMPIYFSPRCNVIYPRMYSSIQINDLYDDAPTRIVSNTPTIDTIKAPISFRYRSPHNVREAVFQRTSSMITSPEGTEKMNAEQIAQLNRMKERIKNGTVETPGMYEETPASHEMGRGVHPQIGQLPDWLVYIMPTTEKDGEDDAKRKDFRQTLLDYNDYQYSLSLSGYRSGQVSCCFNPYIVVGYPMDIVDPSQERPSHHAFCTSVVHSITPYQASTEISFSNAMTYEELYAFETPTTLPWLASLLGISKQDEASGNKFTSIVNVDKAARDQADKYYRDVLGVGAAFVDDLSEYKYSSSKADDGIAEVKSAVDSLEDSLAACRRSIQNKFSVEQLFDFKFIDTEGLPQAGTNKVIRNYPFRPALAEGDKNKSIWYTSKVKPGHNLFLDYSKFVTEVARGRTILATDAQAVAFGSTVVTSSDVTSNTNAPVRTEYQSALPAFAKRSPADYKTLTKIEDELVASYGTGAFPRQYKRGLFSQLIFTESGFVFQINKNSKSERKWAYGYGQILPAFWDGRFRGKKVKDLTGEENLLLAKEILVGYYKRFQNWNDAVVSYNQGENTVAKFSYGGRCVYKACNLDIGGAAYFCRVFNTDGGKK